MASEPNNVGKSPDKGKEKVVPAPPPKGKKGFFGTLFGALDTSAAGTPKAGRDPLANPLEVDFGDSVRSGWLLKLSSGKKKKYEKRYAILREGAMFYYKNKPKTESEPSNKCIPLEGYVPMVEGRVKGQCVLFKLVHVSKPVHHFATDSEAILSEWVKALHIEMFREVSVLHDAPVGAKPRHTKLLEQLADIPDIDSWGVDPDFENSLRARREARRAAQQEADEEETERRNAQLQVLIATKEILKKDLAVAKGEESRRTIEKQLGVVRQALQDIVDGRDAGKEFERASLSFARPSEVIPRRQSELSEISQFSSSLPRNSELYGSTPTDGFLASPTPRNSEHFAVASRKPTVDGKLEGEVLDRSHMSPFQLRKLAERERALKERQTERDGAEQARREELEKQARQQELAKLELEKQTKRDQELDRLAKRREEMEKQAAQQRAQELEREKQAKSREELARQQEAQRQKLEQERSEKERQLKLEKEAQQAKELQAKREQKDKEDTVRQFSAVKLDDRQQQQSKPKAKGPVAAIPADSKVGKLPIHEYPAPAPGKLTGMPAMLYWAQQATRGFPGVQILNFGKSWQNGLAFAALLANWRPDVMDYWSLDPADALGNLKKAFHAAEKAGVSMLLDAEDVVDVQDPKSLYTQMTMYHRTLNHLDPAPRPWEAGSGSKPNVEAKTIPKEVKNLISLVQSFERRLQELNWRAVEQGDGEALFEDLKAAYPKIERWKTEYADELSATIQLYNRLNKEIPTKVNNCLTELQSKRSGAVDLNTCATCGKPLGGRTVEAVNLFFHAECFKCFNCGKPLVKTCINVKDKPHCDLCGRNNLSRR